MLHLLLVAPAAASTTTKHSTIEVLVPALSALGAILVALFGYFRGRRTDTITLYSTFVDDLHNELDRTKTQFHDDRETWDKERTEMKATLLQLESDNSTLKKRVQSLETEIRRLRRGTKERGSASGSRST